MKVVVYHDTYGCETGCCGHTVAVDDQYRFVFAHREDDEDLVDFAKSLVEDAFGKKHCEDLDWDNIVVMNDGTETYESCPF